jgi:hypothetical protein
VYEFGNSSRICFWNVDSRHARIPSAPGNDGSDQFSVLIVQHELRPKQVRLAVIAAAKIRTVTAAAVNTEQRLATLDDCRVGQRSLLGRKRLASSTTSALAVTLRHRRRRKQYDETHDK